MIIQSATATLGRNFPLHASKPLRFHRMIHSFIHFILSFPLQCRQLFSIFQTSPVLSSTSPLSSTLQYAIHTPLPSRGGDWTLRYTQCVLQVNFLLINHNVIMLKLVLLSFSQGHILSNFPAPMQLCQQVAQLMGSNMVSSGDAYILHGNDKCGQIPCQFIFKETDSQGRDLCFGKPTFYL